MATDENSNHGTPQKSTSVKKTINTSAPVRPIVNVAEIVGKAVKALLGTEVPDDAPLMGAGLDSIAAVELV